jgi:hypothetical protein
MDEQPNPNRNLPQTEDSKDNKSVTIGGDHNVVHGNVGPGAVVGRGTVHGTHFAGHDLIIQQGSSSTDEETQFSDLLVELKELIVKARESGEIGVTAAQQVISDIEQASDLVKKDKKPPKGRLVQKLSSVSSVLEAAVEVVVPDESKAEFLLRAVSIAAVLIRLAMRLF